MKIFKIVAILLVLLFVFMEFFIFSFSAKKEFKKPLVSVSTFSLYDITKYIAGESIDIVNILPFGVDPHSFELTPKIMLKIEKSVLVFYSGAGLEPWIDKITFAKAPINISEFVDLLELEQDEHEEDEHHHDEHCGHGALDPHYWLDFINMQKMTRVITQELIKILPANKETYEKNRDAYIKMLEDLDLQYKSQLHSCQVRSVILNHNALGYLANRYDFEVHSLSGLSPEAESSAKAIQRILKEISQDGIETVFYESFVDAKVIQSIASDSRVKIEVLQPLGNITASEAKSDATYESLMLENLKKLSKAMICH